MKKTDKKKEEMAKKMYDMHGKPTGFDGGMKIDMHGKNSGTKGGMKHDMHGKNTGYGKGMKSTQRGPHDTIPKHFFTQHGSGSTRGGGMDYTM